METRSEHPKSIHGMDPKDLKVDGSTAPLILYIEGVIKVLVETKSTLEKFEEGASLVLDPMIAMGRTVVGSYRAGEVVDDGSAMAATSLLLARLAESMRSGVEDA